MNIIKFIFYFIFGVSLLSFSGVAHAQEACAPRDKVVMKLTEKFGETLKSLGLNNTGVVEVYNNEETGTWTILLTRPDGISCLLAAGQRWETNIKPLHPPGDPVNG